jgi:signal transduction histidine kinase
MVHRKRRNICTIIFGSILYCMNKKSYPVPVDFEYYLPHIANKFFMKRSLTDMTFDLRIKTGYSVAFLLLLISYIVTFYGNRQLIRQTSWIIHTNEVIRNLEVLVSGVKDAETGLRGYVNTKDTSFLSPYMNSIVLVNASFRTLKEDTKDDSFHQRRLKELDVFIQQRYAKLRFAISYFPKSGYIINDTLMMSFYEGKIAMDRIRRAVNEMQEHEQGILISRTKELDERYNALNTIIITSLTLALLFAVFGFYTYRREYKARLEADRNADDYQKQLQQRIAELDKANKELVLMRRSEKFAATGRIARTIAHEVRNPLTNIDLAMTQIRSDLPVNDSSNILFDMVQRNSERINQLISELLNATRFAELKHISVSVNSLLDETLEMAKDRIGLNHIRIEKKYSQGIGDISVDPEKLKIAFLNLIVNAIEAMKPDSGVLKISTRAEENKCVIEITDNGSGMTEEQLNNLFEPYFTTKSYGNGLGLTNTHNIILNHRGTINVSSISGEGTTFVIRFNFTEQAEDRLVATKSY